MYYLDPTKYFGIELGAQTHIDATNERYIVNGSHDEEKMQGKSYLPSNITICNLGKQFL